MGKTKRGNCDPEQKRNDKKRVKVDQNESRQSNYAFKEDKHVIAPKSHGSASETISLHTASGILQSFLQRRAPLELAKSQEYNWRLSGCVEAGCACSRYTTVHKDAKHEESLDTAGESSHHEFDVLCLECSHGPATHTLEYVMANVQSKARDRQFRLLCELFVVVRNARSFGHIGGIGKETGWGSGWVQKQSASTHKCIVRCLTRALELCVSLRSETDLYSANTVTRHLQRAKSILHNPDQNVSLPSKLKGGFGTLDFSAQARGVHIAAELDNVYWHILYSAQTHFPLLQGRRRSPAVIPPPEVYFTCLTHNPPTKDMAETSALTTTINEALKVTLDLEFSSVTGEPLYCHTSNPLLAVLQSTWVEMELCARVQAWIGQFNLKESSNAEKTMRDSDPLMPQPLTQRCDSVRDWSARLMAFAVPNSRAYSTLSKFRTIVEVGAGVGYWKYFFDTHKAGSHSSDAHTGYLAFDKDPPISVATNQTKSKLSAANQTTMNEYHGHSRAWATVQRGGPESVKLSALQDSVVSKVDGDQKIAVLSCYPPPYGNLALDCLKLADKLDASFVYVGEINGDTGTLQFQQVLAKNWTLSESVDLPCFSNTAFGLKVFVKKQGAVGISSLPNALFECSAEGCIKRATRRCRRTRDKCFCSKVCHERAVADGSYETALVLRHQKLLGKSIDFMSDKDFRSVLEWPKVNASGSATGGIPSGKAKSKNKKRRKK